MNPEMVENDPPVTRLITLVTLVGLAAVQTAVSVAARLKVVKLWNRLPPAWVPPEIVVTAPAFDTVVPVAKALVSGTMLVVTWATAGAAAAIARTAAEASSPPRRHWAGLNASLPAR